MAIQPIHQLDVFRQNARKHRHVKDCYRLLYQKPIWKLVVNRVCDPETEQKAMMLADDMIFALREETFRFKEKNLQDSADDSLKHKLMLEAVTVIMQSVFDDVPVHRGQRAVPVTINHMKRVFTQMNWCISGEVSTTQMSKGAICQLAARRIKDHRFIRLLHHLLKQISGIINDQQHQMYELLFAICMTGIRRQLKQWWRGDGNIELVWYQNNLAVGLNGSKKDSLYAVSLLKQVVEQKFGLTFTAAPRLCHFGKAVPFLGYYLKRISAKRQENEKIKFQSGKIHCYISDKQLQVIAKELQYGNYVIFKSSRKSKVMNLSEFEILDCYNRELKRLIQYYRAVDNDRSLFKLRALAQSSFLKTISAKRKSTAKKTAKSLRRPGYKGLWFSKMGKNGVRHWICFMTVHQLSSLIHTRNSTFNALS